MTDRAVRETVAETARRLHARGWVANHDGNVTARLGKDRIVATPTAVSKADVTAAGLLVVDDAGKKVSGSGNPFSEIHLHTTVYRGRDDVHAVVHAHPPMATALACAGSRLLEVPFLPEAVVSLGATIPTVPFAAPGPDACAALAPFVPEVDAVLLESHGALAWGKDLETAYLRLELVEHLARIALEAERVGGVRPLPVDVVGALLEKRAKAGLGKAAEKAGPKQIIACAPAPPGATLEVVMPGSKKPDLARIIREEVLRALKEGPDRG